jgi:hypothetical protein
MKSYSLALIIGGNTVSTGIFQNWMDLVFYMPKKKELQLSTCHKHSSSRLSHLNTGVWFVSGRVAAHMLACRYSFVTTTWKSIDCEIFYLLYSNVCCKTGGLSQRQGTGSAAVCFMTDFQDLSLPNQHGRLLLPLFYILFLTYSCSTPWRFQLLSLHSL